MNILAINGSPHGGLGNTDLILQPLLKGMESAGAKMETIYLNKLNIKHCIGCFNCWFKTPGKCIHNDDMEPLLEKKRNADLIIYATPLYVFSTTGLMKDFLDRGIPNLMPFFEENVNENKIKASITLSENSATESVFGFKLWISRRETFFAARSNI